LGGHTDTVWTLAVLHNGDLASGSYRTIKFWNVETGKEKISLLGHSNWILSLAVLPFL